MIFERILEAITPREYVDSLERLDLDKLRAKGIRALILDLDNTIVPWGSASVEPWLPHWFARAREKGFRACIVSNNYGPRVDNIARTCGVPVLAGAAKPRTRAFRDALKLLGASPTEAAAIGDQVFTDILGANRLNLYSILVKPLTPRDFFLTRVFRWLEALALPRIARRIGRQESASKPRRMRT